MDYHQGMSETFDMVVLGLGVMGASAVHQLAGRGVRVLGLDANQRGHVLGSSHGRSRIIREAYYEAAEYVPLVQRAFIQWRELEEETGLDLLLMTGCLNIGRPGTQVVDGVIASARRHGLPSEILTSDAMRSRFPAFALPESHVGVYQPTAGVLNADACVGALVDASVARGATIRHGELVNNWEPDGDGVIVRTPSGTIRAQKLVITAGPWSASVLADLGLPLQAVRQYVVHFEPQAPERFSPPGFPAFIWDVAEGEVYGIPYLPGSGFKVGGHDPGEPCTPETARRTVTAEEIENVRSIFERCLPGCATTMSMAATCLYTVTPDRHFIIDRHPEHPQVSYAAGFSGHGFKFGPTIGEVLADLAIEGSSRHDVAFLRAARFPAAS